MMKFVLRHSMVILMAVSSGILYTGCGKDSPDPVLPPIVIPTDPPPPSSISIPEVDNDITTFMAKYNIPGISIAITRYGKLVYAKGYGFADKEAGEMVHANHRFRLASLSKWFTSAAIMTLIQQGKLGFNDKVFGPGAILGETYGEQPYGPYVKDITIEQLLHHTAGGWTNSGDNYPDPMFAQRSLNVYDLLSWTLNNHPLENPPGTKWAYSNIGFSILSRVIEKVSGTTYTEYVKDNIFTPCGITNMAIGSSTLSGRKPNEVKYYGLSNDNPYGYGDGVIERLDGAGGWIATPTDLMRFLVRVDGFPTVADILNTSTLNLMSSQTSASNYACGFIVSGTGNWYHGGTLTGSRNWMVRTTNGFCWAILINTKNSAFNADLDKLIWPAVNNPATKWPDHDLF